jgi:hypothetical protein
VASNYRAAARRALGGSLTSKGDSRNGPSAGASVWEQKRLPCVEAATAQPSRHQDRWPRACPSDRLRGEVATTDADEEVFPARRAATTRPTALIAIAPRYAQADESSGRHAPRCAQPNRAHGEDHRPLWRWCGTGAPCASWLENPTRAPLGTDGQGIGAADGQWLAG